MAKGQMPPHAWKPGVSGNPGGRPAVSADLKAICRAHTMEAVQALLEALKSPRERVMAATALLDRGYGRPVQTQNVRVIRDISDLSDDELIALAGNAAAGAEALH